MYEYIKGKVVRKTSNKLIIENGGIGYSINISNTDSINEGEDIIIYTYYSVSQDNIALYGFLYQEDKTMFEKLLSVSKIGAKTAIGILRSNK